MLLCANNNHFQAAMLSLKGIFPPLPTALDQQEELLTEKLAENIRSLSRYPLAGFLILGSNGELCMLSHEEKIRIFHAAREAITPGKLMLAGTGCESTRETISLTRQAVKAGADAVMVLNPSFYKGQMQTPALVAHYHKVADASEAPVIIYNMPANTGLDMGAETIAAIATHPNIIGMKDSGGNVAKLGEVLGRAKPEFQALAGSAGFLLPALAMGAVGGVLALANIAPQACLDILNAFEQNDMKRAQSIQHKMIPVNAAVTSKWGVAALKAAMDYLGLYGGPARLPLQPLSPALHSELIHLLETNQIRP